MHCSTPPKFLIITTLTIFLFITAAAIFFFRVTPFSTNSLLRTVQIDQKPFVIEELLSEGEEILRCRDRTDNSLDSAMKDSSKTPIQKLEEGSEAVPSFCPEDYDKN